MPNDSYDRQPGWPVDWKEPGPLRMNCSNNFSRTSRGCDRESAIFQQELVFCQFLINLFYISLKSIKIWKFQSFYTLLAKNRVFRLASIKK